METVKLDTNGTNPGVLRTLLHGNLIDALKNRFSTGQLTFQKFRDLDILQHHLE